MAYGSAVVYKVMKRFSCCARLGVVQISLCSTSSVGLNSELLSENIAACEVMLGLSLEYLSWVCFPSRVTYSSPNQRHYTCVGGCVRCVLHVILQVGAAS